MGDTSLEFYIKFHGISIAEMAKMLNLSVSDFINKMEGKEEFRFSEMKTICEALHLKESEIDKIFFGKKG